MSVSCSSSGVWPLFNMDTDFILEQVQHMKPSSFSAREQQRYRAEASLVAVRGNIHCSHWSASARSHRICLQKMLMRLFVLMKLQNQVHVDLLVGDMKKWLLHGRSFLEEWVHCGISDQSSLQVRKNLTTRITKSFFALKVPGNSKRVRGKRTSSGWTGEYNILTDWYGM